MHLTRGPRSVKRSQKASPGDSAVARSVWGSSMAASTTASEPGKPATADLPAGNAGEPPHPSLHVQTQESRLRAIKTSPSKAGARSRQNSMQRGAGSRQDSMDRRAAAAGAPPVPLLKLGALGAGAGGDSATSRQRRCASAGGAFTDLSRTVRMTGTP